MRPVRNGGDGSPILPGLMYLKGEHYATTFYLAGLHCRCSLSGWLYLSMEMEENLKHKVRVDHYRKQQKLPKGYDHGRERSSDKGKFADRKRPILSKLEMWYRRLPRKS